MQDLVRVRVADAAEQPRIGERPLHRVALRPQPLGEFDRAWRRAPRGRRARTSRESAAPAHEVERRAALRPGLGERAASRSETRMRRDPFRAAALSPRGFQCSRPAIIRWMTMNRSSSSPIDDALAERARRRARACPTSSASGGSTVRRRNGVASRTSSSGWPTMRLLERFDVDGDVGQLGHATGNPTCERRSHSSDNGAQPTLFREPVSHSVTSP